MGVPCVVKGIELDKQDMMPLWNEAHFLELLHDLDCVVDMLALGRTWGGAALILSTAFVEGRHLKV